MSTEPFPVRTFPRLASGAAKLGVSLSSWHLDRFQRYCTELEQWSRRVNLVSAASLEEVEARHFLDSLTVVSVLPGGQEDAGRLLDVGAGAGFPGLPLRLVCPHLRVALLESVGKKTAFLRHLCSRLGLEDVEVYTGRAEALGHTLLREAFDTVVSRGVAPMNVLAELTLPFCRVGGMAVLMKRAEVAQELDQAKAAMMLLGGEVEAVSPVDLEELGEGWGLVVVRKVASTPERYPRRPGVPAKRPLSGAEGGRGHQALHTRDLAVDRAAVREQGVQ